jgi:hypothetical protein
MSKRKSSPVKIAILGGDLLVGRSLTVTLRGLGYDACFHHGSLSSEPADLPEEVRLVIFGPRMSTGRRKIFLGRVRDNPGRAEVPVLELVAASEASRNGRKHERVGVVSWPCATEALGCRIEAALLDSAGSERQ